MRNLKSNRAKFIISLFSAIQILSAILILSRPLPAAAQTEFPSLNFKPQVNIPNSEFMNATSAVGRYDSATGKMNSTLLARYIKAFYDYGITIAGILATIVLMAGGVVWLVSGGDSGKIGQAKELITGSIVGMLILVCAWIILNTVNPNLVKLEAIKTTVIKKVATCCDPTKGGVLMDKEGNCTSGSKCQGSEKCEPDMNKTPTTYSCVDRNKYACCQFGKFQGEQKTFCLLVDKINGKANTAKCDAKYAALVASDPNWTSNGAPYTAYDTSCLRLGQIDGYMGIYCTTSNLCPDTYEDGRGCSDMLADHWCYRNTCVVGPGKAVNDPCGNDKGRCLKVTDNSCPGKEKHDTGARECDETLNLRCCTTY